MKISPLLLLLVASPIAFTALAQQSPAGFETPSGPLSARAAADAGPGDLKRLDVEFPGGTPNQLVATISKALGRPLNAIIPDEHKETKIMPIKVFGVTVPELFSALESASAVQRPIVTSASNGNKSVHNLDVKFGFRPNTRDVTEQTVWSFYSTAPTPEMLATTPDSAPADQVCQYFQLAPYLDDHTIEDITTAIQTGWKMLKVEPLPQISFHQETKLLIAVGPAPQIAQIPQVISALQRDDSAAVEKIVKLQAELAAVEAKKNPNWESTANDLRLKIQKVVQVQRARDEITSPKMPGSPNYIIRAQ